MDCGQKVTEFVDDLSAFMDLLQAQFGFDDRTVGILGEVYRAIQEKYADKTAKERGWYFARALSQMAEYNNKSVSVMGISIETHAWRKGAGWVYKYDGEKDYFVNELGIAEADYRYMRQMVRLQHMMASDDENYGYDAVAVMKENDFDKFKFIYSILYKPSIFKAYRLLNVQTLCIFPCFCPYEPKQGKFFILRRLPYPAVLRKYASLPL